MILFPVLLLWSCAPSVAPDASTWADADEAANAAFESQQVDVHFVAALSRYERGDKAGAASYLKKAGEVVKKQGGIRVM